MTGPDTTTPRTSTTGADTPGADDVATRFWARLPQRRRWPSRLNNVLRAASVGLAAVAALTLSGCANGSTPPSMTTRDAWGRARYYAEEVRIELPDAHLSGDPGQGGYDNCDEPTHSGLIDYAEDYELMFSQPHDNSRIFNQLKRFWAQAGYRVMLDQGNTRLTVATRDSFWLSLYVGDLERLYLSISSPCFQTPP